MAEERASRSLVKAILSVLLVVGIFTFYLGTFNPWVLYFIAFPMFFIAMGMAFYLIRSERKELSELPFTEIVLKKMSKHKTMAYWYDFERDFYIKGVGKREKKGEIADILVRGNTGKSDGFILGKVAAFGGPHWEVGALIFEDKGWIDEKRLSSILDASKKQYRDEKWKWMWVIIGSKSGFDSTTKKFLSKLKIKEIGLMLVDLRRKFIIRGSNLLSKEAAKVIKPSGFEIKELSLKDIWR